MPPPPPPASFFLAFPSFSLIGDFSFPNGFFLFLVRHLPFTGQSPQISKRTEHDMDLNKVVAPCLEEWPRRPVLILTLECIIFFETRTTKYMKHMNRRKGVDLDRDAPGSPRSSLSSPFSAIQDLIMPRCPAHSGHQSGNLKPPPNPQRKGHYISHCTTIIITLESWRK